MSQETTETFRGCPVTHTDYTQQGPILSHYDMLEEDRESAPILWNDSLDIPFWMIQRHEHVLEALKSPDIFSSDVVQAVNPYGLYFLPNQWNPPAHSKLRRILNRWFSPSTVRSFEGDIRKRCVELIEEIQPDGKCDFVSEFAIRYPTDMLLHILGMPIEDGPQMVEWVEMIFGGAFGGEGGAYAVEQIKNYYAEAFADREKNPRDPQTDFVTYLLEAEIDGEPLQHDDRLTICMTLMTAGLDTTRSALGYIYHHLATYPEDRRALVDDPSRISDSVEEFVRLYNLIMQDGRIVAKDTTFHGVEMKKGDIVWLGTASACRDPRKFEDPDEFQPDRPNLRDHVGWGAGHHTCIGMHLARFEIQLAVEEWHKRIPNYRLAPSAEIVERGTQLSLVSLPLEWDAN